MSENNPQEDKSLSDIIKSKNLNLTVRDDKVEVPVIMTMAKKEKDEDYYPDDDDLVKINALALKKLDREQVMVFSMAACDMDLDRGYEHFSRKALTHMAELAIKNKIPFLADGDYDHQWRQKNIYGIVFDASIKSQKLVYKVYIPIIEKTKNVLEAIMTGLYSKLSVGFSIDPMDYVCDSCKKSMLTMACPHYPGGTDEKGMLVTATLVDVSDNYEVSGVAVPMQPEAHIMKQTYDNEIFKKAGIISKGLVTLNIALKDVIPVFNSEKDELVGFLRGDGEFIEVEEFKLNTDLYTEIKDQTEGVDTITNGTSSTIKDHSMADQATKTPEELEAEALAEVEAAAQKSAEEEEANKLQFAAVSKALDELKTQLAELSEKKPEVEVKVDASAVDASVKAFSESVEKVMKAVEEQNQAVTKIAESIEKLEKTVEAAMVGSLKSVVELMSTTKTEAPVRDENASWVNDAFAVK